ncbi:histamine N-methyl transferase [Saccoglossus kowalevskii]|uniref:Histamine N-methyl transferase n=1 Tax=Saccoglossus kowalevskii TaxID=10224 RepID=D1LX44_SACKO|nr:histamine N-methyl transferase [Saccoglossus kowalevskii]ACY92550.1 histamine N-methyl transferase [Saccoglossus kowalevskii]
MAKSITSLKVDMDKYHESFQVMMKYGLQSRENGYADDARDLVTKLHFDSSRELRVLSIGSGNGNVDQHFINALVGKYSKIYYCVIEPVEKPVQEFKTLVKSNRWDNVTFDFRLQGINPYLDKGGKTDKYDFIHACNSVYEFRDPGQDVPDLYNMVNTGGLLFLRTSSGGWEQCRANLSKCYTKYGESTVFPGAGMVKDILTKVVPNPSMESLHRSVLMTITECFNEKSEDGNKLLDFIHQVLNFRSSVPVDDIPNLLKYLRDECCEIVGEDIMLDAGEDDILVRKE